VKGNDLRIADLPLRAGAQFAPELSGKGPKIVALAIHFARASMGEAQYQTPYQEWPWKS
jgi:hypothetical protein